MHPFVKAAQSGGERCVVPHNVAPRSAVKVEATCRPKTHGSACHAPTAHPSESMMRRFTPWTTGAGKSSNFNPMANSAIRSASVFFIGVFRVIPEAEFKHPFAYE